jgi:hypothetical protein
MPYSTLPFSGAFELTPVNVMKWLLDSDPAIRWQVMRDLTQEDEPVVAAERSRVATDAGEDRGWLVTVHTLTLLKDLGADPEARQVRRAVDRVRKHVTWYQLDGRPYFDGETEPCINGRILATGAYFGEPSKRLLDRLLGERLEDGGWNCEAPKSTCSSFHSTICVLEGLLEYEKTCGRSPPITKARARAIEIVNDRGHQNGLWPLNRIDSHRFTFDMEPRRESSAYRGARRS